MPPPAVAGAQALEHPADSAGSGSRHRIQQTGMAAHEDTAIIAGQLADLTQTVEQMADQLKAFGERADSQQRRADSQQEHTEIQQERIDLAARELAEVSDRLQAAANALRASI